MNGSGSRGGNGLSAGWYTLLPASYAALPGAYLIMNLGDAPTRTVLTATNTQLDGSVITTGYTGNTLDGSVDQDISYWQVMTGSQLRQYHRV